MLIGMGNYGCQKVIQECLEFALEFQVDISFFTLPSSSPLVLLLPPSSIFVTNTLYCTPSLVKLIGMGNYGAKRSYKNA
jgi:hypothetical protein